MYVNSRPGTWHTVRPNCDYSIVDCMESIQVTIPDEATVKCRPRVPLSLELRRQGIKAVTVGCRGGGCGVCRVHVLSGEYETRPMSRAHVSVADEARGYALACCVLPLSDLVIRAAPEDGDDQY